MFVIFITLTIVLPFIFLIYLKDASTGIIFLFVGFVILFLFALGSNTNNFFPFVLFYGFFAKLPIRPDDFPPIRSIPPTDYKLWRKASEISHVDMSYSDDGSEVEIQPSKKKDKKKKKEKQK